MSKKLVFYAFEGEKMCFTHLLINAVDMQEKGMDVKIVIEGKATKLVKDLLEEDNQMFKNVIELGLIDAVCKACSDQMGVLEYIEGTDLPINGDLKGHPPMEPYLDKGYELVIL